MRPLATNTGDNAAARFLPSLSIIFITGCTMLSLSSAALGEKSAPPTSQSAAAPSLKDDVQRLTNQIVQLQIRVGKLPARDDMDTVKISAFAALLGVTVAGFLTLLGNWQMARWEQTRVLELARQEALFKGKEKILEFRLKQLESFHAPMFALLTQSQSIYFKLLDELVSEYPDRYEMGAAGEEYPAYVIENGKRLGGFRLLDQLPFVKKDPRALVLVDSILEIGAKITATIAEHGGLATDGLIGLLGEYLAHYAILSNGYKSGPTAAHSPESHKIGYYPRDLNTKIEREYRKLNDFIETYANVNSDSMAGKPKPKGL